MKTVGVNRPSWRHRPPARRQPITDVAPVSHAPTGIGFKTRFTQELGMGKRSYTHIFIHRNRYSTKYKYVIEMKGNLTTNSTSCRQHCYLTRIPWPNIIFTRGHSLGNFADSKHFKTLSNNFRFYRAIAYRCKFDYTNCMIAKWDFIFKNRFACWGLQTI